ncbi:N-acetylmuramoyl-L-alanine amidase [Dyella sp.]|jgi:N-acetylmuramoyl-L-alanine amidase|uniref:N-acetylmuramoyl-L-alanine amidase n=1 Tax=Dyella sp. TaxID=1869338 RepID=UPI002D772935|nr:N-acetylmuramoyl-L-alanine amidase [Dyella sp.]HET6433032.1 N-acetylmuramoyl-L-alanine amidase [Dyella sp.]
MTATIFRPALVTLAAMAAALAPLSAGAAEVRAARVWAGPEYTRVVFDLSGPVRYQASARDGRIQLDLAGDRLASGFAAPAAQGLFRGLSTRRRGDQLQLVAETDSHRAPKSFLLKPSGSYGYRLVLDLYPDAAATSAGGASVAAAPVPVMKAAPAIKSGHGDVMSLRQVAEQLNGQRKVVVAVDAGHGGDDPGAHGPGGTQEKNVTLAVARQLAALINKQPGMQAVLTRDSDYFIPLKRRYQIARDKNADMFVSIHADAFKNGDAKGSSVWVLSPRGKTSEAARWLADRENRADLIGGVSLDDKDDSLAAVLLDLQQGYAMQASESIAGNVLKALAHLGPTHRGYVERANFVVLRSPDVPSILVETAFISNPAEERKLRDPEHQTELAQAVMGGVRNYFEATPPPGTWFAAEAARRSGAMLAATQPRPDSKASVASVDARADAAVRDLHRVSRGESLGSIARQYGVSVGAIKSANGMSDDTVRAGAVLAIPAG